LPASETTKPQQNVTIRPITAGDRAGWEPLWQGYCRFYEAPVTEEITETLWQRLLDPAIPVFCFVAEMTDGTLAGFVHGVVHFNTWNIQQICYLEDLFVDQSVRGGRIGEKLIDALIDKAKNEGLGRVYWHTHALNKSARTLYDRYHPADMVVRYTVKLG
jgi:GNAT superfamily N-acetyltransferase